MTISTLRSQGSMNPGDSSDDLFPPEHSDELEGVVADLSAKMRYQIAGLLKRQGEDIQAIRVSHATAATAQTQQLQLVAAELRELRESHKIEMALLRKDREEQSQIRQTLVLHGQEINTIKQRLSEKDGSAKTWMVVVGFLLSIALNFVTQMVNRPAPAPASHAPSGPTR